MSAALLGLGCATPEHAISQADFASAARERLLFDPSESQLRLLPTLYRRTGVRRRGSVVLEPGGEAGYRQSFYRHATDANDRGPTTAERMDRYEALAPNLAGRSAAAALTDAGVPPSAITHLVTVCCTGFAAPGVDVHLIKGLGLAPTTQRIHVGFMGCHGAVNGLRVAQALVESDATACVLLVAVELCSLHLSYGWDPDRVVANALFADGAAALVIGRGPEGARASSDSTYILRATGSCLLPDSEDAMSWRVGDHGFEMTLSARVPGLIGEHLRPWLGEWLARHDLSLAAVASWAIHPGGPRIVSSVSEALGLVGAAVELSNAVLAEHGNMSSPTVLFILDRLRRAGAPRPCVALGFGPGLVAEAALFV